MKPSISLEGMLIVADDLTGAADCGIACSAPGLRSIVLLNRQRCEVDADVIADVIADIIAIDTDSRRMSAMQAAVITTRTVREQMRAPRQLLYKKLDSTLRGHIGVELAAALRAFRETRASGMEGPRAVIIVAPAFPEAGRTTVAGRQLLNGAPLEQSEMWRRERLCGSADLPEILQSAGLPAESIALHIVQSSPDRLRSRMMELCPRADALVCDAESEEDLRAIATASVSLGLSVMWAGSAGLAHHLPRAAEITSKVRPVADDHPIASGPALFVIGSLSSVSREQVSALAREIRSVCLSPRELRAGQNSPEWSVGQSQLAEAMQSGSDIVLHLAAETDADLTQGCLLSNALAKLCAPHANAIGGLVLAGGETARAVLDAFGITQLRMIEELEPGLPFSIAEGWTRKLPVLTKAGEFGNPQSLVHCLRYLRQLDRGRMPANLSLKHCSP